MDFIRGDIHKADAAKIQALAQEVFRSLPDLHGKVEEADEVTRHLLNRLLVATDYGFGCAVLSEAGLGPPLVSNVRALFENFIGTYWASQSDQNARVLAQTVGLETRRVLNLNLTKGHARMINSVTKQDQTKAFLQDSRLASGQRLPRIDNMAEEAGVRKIYDQFYGLLSTFPRLWGARACGQGPERDDQQQSACRICMPSMYATHSRGPHPGEADRGS